jgi:predicted Zn-dependent protease with MMP-like domain
VPEEEADLTPEEALDEALAWIAEEPDAADAHYEAGLAYEALGNEALRRRHFLETLRLDASPEAEPLPDYEAIIFDQVERTLAELPADFTERLGPVTILVEPRPSRSMVEEGLDPRLLGLFDGATAEELALGDAPLVSTRIYVFSHNLASTFRDEPSLRDEVTVTVLHEVGHFFGLDEDDMERLGLD